MEQTQARPAPGDRPYEPPGVEDLGTLEQITGANLGGAAGEGMGVKT